MDRKFDWDKREEGYSRQRSRTIKGLNFYVQGTERTDRRAVGARITDVFTTGGFLKTHVEV